MRSVDVAWNNPFRKIFNACWWESMKSLHFYCSCLPVFLLVYRHKVIIFWLKCTIVTTWLFMHLLIAVKTVSLAHLRNIESTVSSISFLRLNIWSKNIFGTILAAIACRWCRPIDFIVLFLCIVFFFVVYCMCAFYVLVLFCCFGVINK